MIDVDALAAERPCAHDWIEIGEKEYWPDQGGIETGECIYLYGWRCLKCGDEEATQTGQPPTDSSLIPDGLETGHSLSTESRND